MYGDRYGEITAVIAVPKPTLVKGDNANNFHLDDPNEDGCVPTAMLYVGMTTQPVQHFWQTNLQINTGLSRPSPRQEAAGQHWAACIVTCSQTARRRRPQPPQDKPPRGTAAPSATRCTPADNATNLELVYPTAGTAKSSAEAAANHTP